MFARTIAKGEKVIEQNAEGDYFYIVKRGFFDILVRKTAATESKKVFEAGAGFAFGELALLYNAPRSATIVATVDSEAVNTPACSNSNDGATDGAGDDCTWYDGNTGACGTYDDSDFSSNDMCCSCGGGTTTTTTMIPQACSNSNNGALDTAGDDCAYYVGNPWACGNWDDSDFRSNDMCCSCGGGNIANKATTTTDPIRRLAASTLADDSTVVV